MNRVKHATQPVIWAMVLLIAAGLVACDKPGPAETAGRKIDQTAEAAGKQLEQTAEAASKKLDQAADAAGRKLEQTAESAGRKINQTTDRVGEKIGEQGAKTGVAMDDAEITAKVKAAILVEPGLKMLQISVDTTKGLVTLSGSVDSLQLSNRARELAGAVAGVLRVDNRLVTKSTALK